TMEMTIGSETKRAIRTYELDMRLKSDGDGEDGSYIILARHRAQEKARKARENAQFHQKWTMPDRDAPDEEWDVWVEEQAMKD
ncbi:MAG: hypothetical protein GWN86_08305, partial [Desulfobacterales bacterium]|nr:hypothetical protein [Desulfobacterales bacterium]